MFLTITLTHPEARDLGYLLHKHPDKHQTFELSAGLAHVFYPEAHATRCTAALMLELDPVALSRRAHEGSPTHALQPYVNDRPYVASSFLSVAIARVLGSALAGRCPARQELADSPLQLQATLPALPSRGGPSLITRCFEPLGYDEILIQPVGLDPEHPEWGEGRLYSLTLRGRLRLMELLAHLYVLIPVLDDDKHYHIGPDEVEKLLRHGHSWLAQHPERERIARHALDRRHALVADALDRLTAQATLTETPEDDAIRDAEERGLERPLSLHDQRLDAVAAWIQAAQARSVLDLGCGEGRLIKRLLTLPGVERIVGVDVSPRALMIAAKRLRLEQRSEATRRKVTLTQGSLLYRDPGLEGFDAAALVEVIEHLDPERLRTLERVVFEHARPGTVIVTTPNVEYNALFEAMPVGQLRHRDHRFEWTRQELRAWASRVARERGYQVTFRSLGPEHPTLGPPTQAAIFTRHGQPTRPPGPGHAQEPDLTRAQPPEQE